MLPVLSTCLSLQMLLSNGYQGLDTMLPLALNLLRAHTPGLAPLPGPYPWLLALAGHRAPQSVSARMPFTAVVLRLRDVHRSFSS